MTTLIGDLTPGTGTYIGDLNSAPLGGSTPSISSATPLRYGGNATITGVNFSTAAGSGAVTIAGVAQLIVSWSDTSIVIGPITRGILKYGTKSLIVVNDVGTYTAPYAAALLPQTGYSYVDLVNPLATSGQRITSIPDLVAGDQLAYGGAVPAGTVVISSDGTFVVDGVIGSFSVEVNDGSGWGSFGTQTISNVESFTGILTSRAASIVGSFQVTPSGGGTTTETFSGVLSAGDAQLHGTILVFTSKTLSGVLRAGPATLSGSFRVTGAVVTPPPLPTPSPGTGTQASKVAIVNMALIKLGASPISSFTDGTKAARISSLLFDRLADQEMSRHYWNFAIARLNLPEAVSNEPQGPYRYAYSKPADWLTTMLVGTEADYASLCDAEWSHEGLYVLTNIAPPCPFMYVRRISDVTQWHALFYEVLASRLGMEMADAMTNSAAKWNRCSVDYRTAVAEARRVNAIQDPPRTLASDSWLAARE